MSDTSTPPSVSPGTPAGFMGGARVALAIGAAAGLGVLGWWLLPERHHVEARTTDRASRPGVIGQPFVIPAAITNPAPVEVARPEPVVARPMAPPAAAKRARPSSMSVYTDAEPPERPARAVAVGGGASGAPAPAQTIAGMQVLRAETITDARFYLMPGDKIPCINSEPLTERTGARFSAVIPEEVRGRDGTQRLIPKGSRAVGRVVKGMDHGERRLAAILTHIEGPTVPGFPTMFVPLGDGQAGDALGAVDLEGNVETHFWSRLGAVAAYAGLDAVARIGAGVATSAITDGLSGGDGNRTNVNVGNFGGLGTGRGLAGRAFDQQIQRQPTFDRPQGQVCTIFVNQPIDFRPAVRR